MYAFNFKILDDLITNMVAAETTSKKPEPAALTRNQLLAVLEDRAVIVGVLLSRPYTCVVVRSWYDDVEYAGVGFSKVRYPDKWDGKIGMEIAKRRAMISIMHQVRCDNE